jgi:type IV pilus assembly protein PilA
MENLIVPHLPAHCTFRTIKSTNRHCLLKPSSQNTRLNSAGFTLIELMIVVAVIAILLSLALPVYSNYSTRAKIAEGLGVAAAAKTSTSAACQENPTLVALSNAAVGYTPTPAMNTNDSSTIAVEGDCSVPTITITTHNTGTQGYDPVIVLTGGFIDGDGKVTWTCESNNTPHHLLPKTCRS